MYFCVADALICFITSRVFHSFPMLISRAGVGSHCQFGSYKQGFNAHLQGSNARTTRFNIRSQHLKLNIVYKYQCARVTGEITCCSPVKRYKSPCQAFLFHWLIFASWNPADSPLMRATRGLRVLGGLFCPYCGREGWARLSEIR
jgi:hypothetical protein